MLVSFFAGTEPTHVAFERHLMTTVHSKVTGLKLLTRKLTNVQELLMILNYLQEYWKRPAYTVYRFQVQPVTFYR